MPQSDEPVERIQRLPDPGPGTQERLESWKEIATFLGRGVRTVQRWEEVEGLPVHRHVHGRGGTVFAYRSEVRQWYDHRESLATRETEAAATPSVSELPPISEASSKKLPWKLLACAGAAAAILIAIIAVRMLEPRPALSTPSILISNIGRISQTVIHPDGDRLVYCWNGDREEKNLDLYLWDRRGGTNRRLTSDANNEHSAAWSPTGDRIAFLRDKAGVFVMTADGRQERLIEGERPGAVYGVGMSWSADGKWLVYSEKESAGVPQNLFLLSVATGQRRQITFQPADGKGDLYASFAPAAFSADGLSVAFARFFAEGKSGLLLLHLASDGKPRGAAEQLVVDQQVISGMDWLPEGRGLVYSSDRTGIRRLWHIDRSRWRSQWSQPELLASAGDDAWQPNVARRGGQIVYSRRFWNAAIWQMDLRSNGGLGRLIGSTRTERSPALSPDGTRVAFISDRSGAAEVWSSGRNGHHETQLTQLRHLEPERPAWSPDGQSIAFSGRSTLNEGIYVMPAAGGSPVRVSSEKLGCNSPTWSYDGKSIYCSSEGPGGEQVWRMPASGGAAAPVASGLRPRASADGKWLYFVRGGGLWRMPTEGGTAEKLVDAPVGDFDLTGRGVYFDVGSGDYTDGLIKFWSLSDRKVTVVSQLDKRKSGGLTVSADDSVLLIPINERQGSEVLQVGQDRR